MSPISKIVYLYITSCLLFLVISLTGFAQTIVVEPPQNVVNYIHVNKDANELPNIVILMADDLGWNDVSYHGSQIGTPYIDEFVKEGVELNRFYTSPACTPTRAGIMTGRYAERTQLGFMTGVIKYNRKGGVSPSEETMAELLAKAGYNNRGCIGKWHLGHSHIKYHPLRQGFTYFYGLYGGQVNYFDHTRRKELDWHRNYKSCYDKGYTTDLIGNEASRFIEEKSEEGPFFLYVAFNAPHVPLEAKMEDLLKYGFDGKKPVYELEGDSMRLGMSTQLGRGNTIRQTYAAMVAGMDASIGQIIKTLKEEGVFENTIVLFMSDNGGHPDVGGNNAPLRGRKGRFYEGGVRVPAAISWPAKGLSGGKKLDEIISHIDLLPTFSRITNTPMLYPGEVDGKDVLEVLMGKQTTEERELYLGKHAIMRGNWKLAYGQLYNLKDDLSEMTHLKDTYPTIYSELRKKLNAYNRVLNKEVEVDLSHKVQPEWAMPGR